MGVLGAGLRLLGVILGGREEEERSTAGSYGSDTPPPPPTLIRPCVSPGEGLLRNLGAAAAAPFGVGLLTHMLRCGAPPARLACATALPLLARYRPYSDPIAPL